MEVCIILVTLQSFSFWKHITYTHIDTCANRHICKQTHTHTNNNNIETLGTGNQQGRNEKNKVKDTLENLQARIKQILSSETQQGLEVGNMSTKSRNGCQQKEQLASLLLSYVCPQIAQQKGIQPTWRKVKWQKAIKYFSSNKLNHLCGGGGELRQSMGEITPRS